MQTAALMTASGKVGTALNGLSGSEPTQAQIAAVETAIRELQAALSAAADVSDAVKGGYQATVSTAQTAVTNAKAALMAMQTKADEAAAAAMAATAAKLYAGISAPTATDATPEADIRFAAYNNDEDAIDVQNGVATADAQELSEDKKTTVAANHGWEGKRYTASGTGVDGTYEAMVYSNVGEPTMGAKFNSGATDLPAVGDLDAATGETGVLSGLTGYAALVASPSFDQNAGTKEFKLATNTIRVMLSGSYYGVSGTYYCTPAADSTCAARKAAEGFELGSTLDDTNAFTAGGWTFKPTNPEARVTETPDAAYASYGWWIHKSADEKTYTASAFVDEKGTVAAAAGITDLQGTATYRGGAAGKYALSSSTGGTNDAGHFTARATLQADFNDDMITGTIDNFMGADGMSRNWSVELMESAIGDTGLIRRSDDDNSDLAATDPGAMTKWTIGGTAGSASGQWTGSLRDNGDDGVPKVGTGTFHSTHGPGNSMVGAFGVNKDD